MLASDATRTRRAKPRVLRQFILIVALTFASMLVPHSVDAQVTPLAGGATVSAVLSTLTDQVGQLIDQAKNAGLSVEMEAGRQVYLALQNAQNAYATSMSQTFDRADTSVKNGINQLYSLAMDVQGNTFGQLDAFSRRVQTIVNALPFRPHQPQVTSITPRFIVLEAAPPPVTIRYSGNFEFASRAGFTPSLKIATDTIKSPVRNTTQDLSFLVPVTDLGRPDPAAPSVVRFVPAVLTVPWEETRYWIFHSRHNDVYRTLVGVLPPSPGRIRVVHYFNRDSVTRSRFVSTTYEVCSIKECGNKDHIDVPFAVSPDGGWTVVRNTSRLDKSWNEGDNANTFVSDDGGQVVYKITTIYHRVFGQSGKVRFVISFDQERHIAVPDSTVTVVNDDRNIGLHWGEQRTFPYPAGSYLVVFDAFDSSHADFRGADNSNRLLTVRDQAGNLVLVAATPSSLVWP